MSRLVTVCQDLGHRDVWTFVNSGNVVFDARGARASVEATMERALEDEFGFECTTFVRTAAQLRTAMDAKPFTLVATDTYFVTFLKKPPSATAAAALQALSNDVDTLVVRGADVHWRMHGKSTDSTLSARDWTNAVGALTTTSRNVTMLTRLLAKIDAR